MKSANYSTIKILFVILTIVFGTTLESSTSFSQAPTPPPPAYVGTGPTGATTAAAAPYAAATSADLSPTCRPSLWNSMVSVSAAKAQRRTVIAQSLITKPDKTEAMTCLAESLLRAAAKIGAIFTDNPSFSGGCSFGGGMISTMLDVLMALETAENLGGGILDGTTRDNLLSSVLVGAVGSFLSGPVSGFMSSAIGSWIGGCLGTIVGSALSAVASSIGAQLQEAACNNMNEVWQGIAMQSVDNKYFMTARQLQQSDPRYDVAGVPPDAFAAALISSAILNKVDGRQIFGTAIDVDLNTVLNNPAFAVISADHFERLAPYDPTVASSSCNALPILGPFISCNRGCKVSGSFPTFTCVPN